ncbi:MAG TPA: tetratricopeptide repeat protein [Bryobacteraceae bacterium]|nr:tetratricopeptide repeat protein [Bryobacteraceae bacterium]
MYRSKKGRSVMRIALLLCTALLSPAQPDALARKSQAAKELMAAGRFAEAIPLYAELSRALPANPGLRLNLALAYQMAGRHNEAIPEFERVLKADPNNFPALLSLGVSELEMNRPAKAIGSLQRAVTLQPSHPESRGMLAHALLSLDRPKEAAIQFRRLSALLPQDPKAWYGLGRSYEALARQAFDELDKTAQGSPEWLALIADSRMESRQFRSAFFFYKQAMEKRPDFPGIHRALAELYRRAEHSDWADIENRKEVRLPKLDCARHKQACDFLAGRFLAASEGPSLYWRSRAYNQLALAALQPLGALPPSIELHATKAEILAGHQQHLEAAQEWDAARRLAPNDPHIQRQLASALYQAGDYEKSVPMLQKLIQQDPAAADLNFFLGDSFLRTEQPGKALPWLETALRQDPRLVPAHASLGLAQMRLGRHAEAIPHLNAALAIDEDGSLHYQLAQAYQRTGDADRAKQMSEKYREIQQRSQAEERKLEQQAVITAP